MTTTYALIDRIHKDVQSKGCQSIRYGMIPSLQEFLVPMLELGLAL